MLNPVPGLPVRTYPTSANISDQVLIEKVTSETAASTPIIAGAPIQLSRDFAGYKLGKQVVDPRDQNWFLRFWVSDETNPDYDNILSIKYLSEGNSFPVFVRAYQEPKATYVARTKNTPLQTVYLLSPPVVAGSGYVYGSNPALTFAGGGGTGAAGYGVVAPDGTVSEFVLTSGGSGYTTAPTFTCAAPPSGVTATGTASIQPTGMVLVAEEPQAYPPESEYASLYFRVIRVYQTLPGPILTTAKWDAFAQDFILTTRQFVLSGSVTPSVIAGVLTEYQPKDTVQDIKMTSQYKNGVPATQTIPIAVPVSVPPVISGTGELSASSGIINAYGYPYTLTSKSGSWSGTLTRIFYQTLAAAVTGAAAHVPSLRFTEESSAYGHIDAASSFNPNFLGHASVHMLHIPAHVTSPSGGTGTLIKDVQVQQHALGYWVLEYTTVVLS